MGKVRKWVRVGGCNRFRIGKVREWVREWVKEGWEIVMVQNREGKRVGKGGRM